MGIPKHTAEISDLNTHVPYHTEDNTKSISLANMSAKNSMEVSHGRGGAGNIGPDSTQYVDGEIVREGVVGEHGDGAFSTGRAGAANIGSPGMKATKRKDEVAEETSTSQTPQLAPNTPSASLIS